MLNQLVVLIISFFAFFMGNENGKLTSAPYPFPHTIYVSVTSIYFPNDGDQPELKIRLFFDDLQRCIKKEWALDETPELGFFAGSNLDRYLNTHIALKLDTTTIAFKMESLEEDGEAISVHMVPVEEVPKALASSWKKMTIQSDLFVNQIEEQQNLVRVRYERKREFFNLDQKRLQAVFTR